MTIAATQNVGGLMTPWGVDIDLLTGSMDQPDSVLVRRASDMRGYYRDHTALAKIVADGDPVHYEVFEKLIPEEQGQLLLCISKLQPGVVGDEFFMTLPHGPGDRGGISVRRRRRLHDDED
jgi:glucose-6-phosphate isomerase